MKILLIEDEQKVAAFILKGLKEEGHNVEHAADGRIALETALSKDFDLIILDIILPYISGVDVCKAIRREDKEVPILMLTALGTTDNKVTGLEAGADDYLVKPFQFKEFIARVNALSRRSRRNEEAIYKIADLVVDVHAKSVKRNAIPIKLTAREFELLELLLRNKGRVMSRVDISEVLWGEQFDAGSNVIDVYVNYLRNKIDKNFSPKLIHTLIGMGYVLREE